MTDTDNNIINDNISNSKDNIEHIEDASTNDNPSNDKPNLEETLISDIHQNITEAIKHSDKVSLYEDNPSDTPTANTSLNLETSIDQGT